MSLNLLEASNEIVRLNKLKDDGFSDLDAIKEVLEIRRGEVVAGVDKSLGAVRYCKGRLRQLEELKTEVLAAIDATKNRLESIKDWVRLCIVELPDEKFVGKTGEFVIQKNGGLRPIVYKVSTDKKIFSNIIAYEDIEKFGIEQKYLVWTEIWSLNTEEIRKDLELGNTTSFAVLEERGDSVRDRV